MAISSFNELQTAVANWLDRADLTARIPEFIALAEAQMNRRLRVRRMVGRSTASISTAFVALPTNYLEAKAVTAAEGATLWSLDPVPAETAAELASDTATGRPQFYAVVGDELRLHPPPDRAYTIEITFYGRIPALSISNTSNWVLAEAPDAYLYGALLQAAPYLRDGEAAAFWNAGYAGALDALSAADRTKAGLLRVEPGLSQSRSYCIRTDI